MDPTVQPLFRMDNVPKQNLDVVQMEKPSKKMLKDLIVMEVMNNKDLLVVNVVLV